MKLPRVLKVWVLVLGLALLLPSAVWAVFISVNTDDAAIDSDWASVAVFLTSPNDSGIADAYDLKEAKVSRESDNSFWYFQTILYGQLPLDNLTSIEARLSCDGDGGFSGGEDKVVLYYHADPPDNDNSIECEGSDYPLCSSGETQGSDFGEEIAVGDGAYSYEWKADIADSGGIDWSTCNGSETMQFVVANESGTVYDATATRIFDAPTLVRVGRTHAQSVGTGLALLGLCLVLGSVVLWRRERL